MDQTTENSIAFMMFFGIIGMLVLATAVILFFLLYQKRLLAQQTHIQEMKLTHQRESLSLFLVAQEAERKRIAQDLHDGIGALLSASKMYLNKLPAKEETNTNVAFIKTETIGLIDETIDNIRTITRDLLPTSLERFGLFAATKDLCRRIKDIGQLNITFTNSSDQRFDAQHEFGLYRIIQELINNSLKYGKATQITVDLNISNQELTLSYQDDGQGFDLQEWKAKPELQKGLGLRGIASRAEVLGAIMEMKSAGGEGFRLLLKMNVTDSQNS